VLIEKPASGNFMPILDGGFSLQYTPLMVYQEGRGMMLFCQMDVTGRTANDPAADQLVRNILQFTAKWKSKPIRSTVYAGDPVGQKHLQQAGFQIEPYSGGPLSTNQVLVVSTGGGRSLSTNASTIATFLEAGGHLLALGLDEQEANIFLPHPIDTRKAEYISSFFTPDCFFNKFAGIGPADVHIRAPQEIPLLTDKANCTGGVLEQPFAHVVFCQLTPWSFDDPKQFNLKQTHRRISFLVTRLLSNLGVQSSTPLVHNFIQPTDADDKRWLSGLYLDQPEDWDDPYRFFRW
jgi:hypothetical protein